MRVYYERTGGFAGIRRATTLDTQELSGRQAQELRQLVNEVHFFGLPCKISSKNPEAVDLFHHKLTVRTTESQHTVEAWEDAVPEELYPLIKWLTTAARHLPAEPEDSGT